MPALGNLLQPLVTRLDRSAAAPHDKPTPADECTRFPVFPWDLRTVIIVFPPEAPFHFLNLNTLLGFTGVPFDRVTQWTGAPTDAFNLQFCLEGRDDAATYNRYHSVAEELDCRANAVQFRLGDRLAFDGTWPEYDIRYAQPEVELDVHLRFHSWSTFQWWAYSPHMYCHYTSFGDCDVEWRWRGSHGALHVPALHDHGWGRNILPIRLPLRVFRYEVLRLPQNGYAISLWTEGPAHMTLKNIAVHRPDPTTHIVLRNYHCRMHEWDVFENYAGAPRRVPRVWTGVQQGTAGTFTYTATRITEPRPVMGDGFLCAFEYEGAWEATPADTLSGTGYVEQMGLRA